MIGYSTIGVRDLPKAEAFYGALLSGIGAQQIFGNERIKFYGKGPGQGAMLALCIPYDEKDPVPGNGTMIAIDAGDQATVQSLYQKACELGAADDGAPGERVPGMFYGAYVRDPDGNKLCFYEMKMG